VCIIKPEVLSLIKTPWNTTLTLQIRCCFHSIHEHGSKMKLAGACNQPEWTPDLIGQPLDISVTKHVQDTGIEKRADLPSYSQLQLCCISGW